MLPLLCLLLSTLACSGPQLYRPAQPRVASSAAYAIALDSFEAQGGREGRFELRVRIERVPEHVRAYRLAIADAREPRCKYGATGSALGIQGARWASIEQPLAAGDVLVASFPASTWSAVRSVPSRVDVSLEDELGMLTCATLPLIDASRANRWVNDSRYSVGMGVGGEGFVHGLGDIESLVTFPFSVGRWLGPLRLSLTFAPGVAQCPRRACASSGESKINNGPYLPLTLAVDAGHSFGMTRLGLAAGYRGAWARVDGRTGQYGVFMHGPVLTPRIGLSLPDQLAPGVPAGERVGGFAGLELPLSLLWNDRGDHAFGVGANLVVSVGF